MPAIIDPEWKPNPISCRILRQRVKPLHFRIARFYFVDLKTHKQIARQTGITTAGVGKAIKTLLQKAKAIELEFCRDHD